MKTKFKDSDLLIAMTALLDEDTIVFGANGHYAIGAQYDKFENYEDSKGTDAAKAWYTNNNELDDYLQKALWLNY